MHHLHRRSHESFISIYLHGATINYAFAHNGIASAFSVFWDQVLQSNFQKIGMYFVLRNVLFMSFYYMMPEHFCTEI